MALLYRCIYACKASALNNVRVDATLVHVENYNQISSLHAAEVVHVRSCVRASCNHDSFRKPRIDPRIDQLTYDSIYI